MKRTNLEKRLRKMAKAAGVEVGLVREGAGHEVWEFGNHRFSIPRHTEINEHTARRILGECEEEASR